MVRQFFTVALTLLTFAPAPADDVFPAGTTARVTMQSEADQLVLASFLKHVDGAVARLTPEAVAKIEQVEDICWICLLDIAENHLAGKKWENRELYRDLAVRGAVFRMPAECGNDRDHLTNPHNKQSTAGKTTLTSGSTGSAPSIGAVTMR